MNFKVLGNQFLSGRRKFNKWLFSESFGQFTEFNIFWLNFTLELYHNYINILFSKSHVKLLILFAGTSGRSVVLRSPEKVALNEWNSVTFRRTGTKADLLFGGVTISSKGDEDKSSDDAKANSVPKQQQFPDGVVQSVQSSAVQKDIVVAHLSDMDLDEFNGSLTFGRDQPQSGANNLPIDRKVYHNNDSEYGLHFENTEATSVSSRSLKPDERAQYSYEDRNSRKMKSSRRKRQTAEFLDVGNELFIGEVNQFPIK